MTNRNTRVQTRSRFLFAPTQLTRRYPGTCSTVRECTLRRGVVNVTNGRVLQARRAEQSQTNHSKREEMLVARKLAQYTVIANDVTCIYSWRLRPQSPRGFQDVAAHP